MAAGQGQVPQVCVCARCAVLCLSLAERLPKSTGAAAARVSLLDKKYNCALCCRVVNEVTYQQPFMLAGGGRLCINCVAAVPGGEAVPETGTLQGMQLLFCR